MVTVVVQVVGVLAITLGEPVVARSAPQNPGAVAGVVPLPDSARLAAAGAEQQRLTYWSRGPRGPMQSTASVYVPPGSPPAGGWPILAYAHGTVGIADHCALTLSPRDYRVEPVFSRLLASGYAVVVSDYVGLGTPGVHPYLDGPAQARSVIDGVRAARAAVVGLGTRWAVLGQSQGGQTALVTAHIAEADAPDLDFRGAASTGAPATLDLFLPVAGPLVPPLPLRRTTAYFAMLLAGMRAAAPELDIDSYLTPAGLEVLRIVETECVAAADERVRNVSIGSMLRRQLDDPAVVAKAREMLHIPTSGYSVPLFLGQGLADREVPAPLSAPLIADLYRSGADFTVRLYPGDHIATAHDALPDVLTFLEKVFSPS